ncbi:MULTISPECIES: P1 family peptidase [unclassified Rhizobacter]|uniref:P1 family peptidase n=1 Tax=unclassified Rhizobacter TaxID=2640088 RepID=UPI000700727C|nr:MULTISPECIES: P1 family peptidase [unclassified Rhizobacter]KQU81534.1 peptidase S58 [Rhizobacter sp. Root29]KQW12135.1 peptidase S58 [Rhizobacter sp. Root1238]KRB02950.1 peptidase S58 [Rhizobacter sp. Root16D2]
MHSPSGLSAVPGLRVGHFTDSRRPTGCTVVLAPAGAVGGVDVRGAAPGTRETDLLSPLNAVEQVHAVMLAGGSAFGLDAAGGVMRWLDERGIGYPVGPHRVPIVPAAILFDLSVGDGRIRPDAAAGYAACEAASDAPCAEGNVGAGAGALVGKLFGLERAMKGGFGSAFVTVAGVTVGAWVAVNAMGDVIDPTSSRVLAGARRADGSGLLDSTQALLRGELPHPLQPGAATTIGVVGTDAVLTKAQANKIAQTAHDGLARSISPVHTQSDGDTVFALATGASGLVAHPTLLGTMAAEAMARAVVRAIEAAAAWGPYPAARDLARPG